jgi:hypothetical protein
LPEWLDCNPASCTKLAGERGGETGIQWRVKDVYGEHPRS